MKQQGGLECGGHAAALSGFEGAESGGMAAALQISHGFYMPPAVTTRGGATRNF